MQRRKISQRSSQRQSTMQQNISFSDASCKKLSYRQRQPISTQKFVNNISLQLSSKKSSTSIVQTLEQLQKKATQDFYNKNYDAAFDTLKCCQQLNGRLASIQHRVYIHYLYTQFHCKLKQYSKSLQHYHTAKQIYIASLTSQQNKLHHYIINIECIHASMLYEMKNFQQAIDSINQIINDLQHGSQQWFKCQNVKLKSCMNLQQFEEGIIIAQELIKFSQSPNEKYKYTLKIVDCFLKLGLPQNAFEILQEYLKDIDKQKEADVINKLSEICLQTGDTIKSIYYLEKLTQFQQYKIDSFKLLCQLYNDVGDWIKVEHSLNNLNKFINLTYQELHLLAKAKHYIGNTEQSIQIYNDVISRANDRIQKLKAHLELSKISQQPIDYQSVIVKQSNHLKTEQSYDIMRKYIATLNDYGHYQAAQHLYQSTLNQTTLQKYPNIHYEYLKDFGSMLEQLDRKNQSQVCYNRANKIRRTS